MSWTTVSDIPFTRYHGKTVADTTVFRNDGQILGSPTTEMKMLDLHNPEDQVVIPVKDDSLQRFTGLRVESLIHPASGDHRLNIVEGWMSFAFFVESDQSLQGGIFDGQNWVPVNSGGVKVPLHTWSRVCFEYDGISIGRLYMNGALVAQNLNMPMGMRQPQQNITIGHWPSGDGRYTFVGKISHTRIDRRDIEDFWRDAVLTMICKRRFSPAQADAMKELMFLMNSLDENTRESIRLCAKMRSEKLLALFKGMRAGNTREIAAQRELANGLRAAWCCSFDPIRAKQIMLQFLRRCAGAPGSAQRAEFMQRWNEFVQIGAMCERTGPPYDRMRELLKIVTPEISFIQDQMSALVQMI